jgi:uncharacterized linocin/CFP29 family protein
MNGLNWTDAQRVLIDGAIAEEVENTRLAHKIIPDFELPEGARAVSADTLDYATGTVDDETQLEVNEPSENFVLTKLQVEDSDLVRAIVGARRAVQQLSRGHDTVVLRDTIRDQINAGQGQPGFHDVVPVNPADGDGLVGATAQAVAVLDGEGYREGYVMVASLRLYALLHTRVAGAADLPIKAVKGLLEEGPVHRTAVLDVDDVDEALVLSIGNGHVDRAVAVAPALEFLRIENNDDHLFRVYERFATRFKETLSAVLLRAAPPDDDAAPPD